MRLTTDAGSKMSWLWRYAPALLQVDSFELAVETPSPPKHKQPQQLPADGGAPATLNDSYAAAVGGQAPAAAGLGQVGGRPAPSSAARPMRPMSLGLSRRSSAVFQQPQQQLLAAAQKGMHPSPLRISLAHSAADEAGTSG